MDNCILNGSSTPIIPILGRKLVPKCILQNIWATIRSSRRIAGKRSRKIQVPSQHSRNRSFEKYSLSVRAKAEGTRNGQRARATQRSIRSNQNRIPPRTRRDRRSAANVGKKSLFPVAGERRNAKGNWSDRRQEEEEAEDRAPIGGGRSAISR